MTEGNGETDKGSKFEWAAVRENELYVGSMGKEFTNHDGSIANLNNMWVVRVSTSGEVRREDWTARYGVVREALGAARPGYLIHEAVLWSDHLKKWIFLPRRVSALAYDDVLDEKRGSNRAVLVDPDFKDVQVVTVKYAGHDPLRGFSSFAFVPGTRDRHVLALRSVEDQCAGDDLSVCRQWSYGSVFDVVTGEILMEEERMPLNHKFEGVEFVNVHIPPPKR